MIGNGEIISVWSEPWIEDVIWRIPLMKNIFINLDLKVSDLIDLDNGSWDKVKLDDLFFPRDVDLITKRKPVVSKEDYWVWDHNRSGEYMVKSGHWLANQKKNHKFIHEMSALPSINVLKEEIWSLQAPTKIKKTSCGEQ